jgi:hypothetical protein
VFWSCLVSGCGLVINFIQIPFANERMLPTKAFNSANRDPAGSPWPCFETCRAKGPCGRVLQMWFPLVTIALTAAICLSVVSFIMGRAKIHR